MILNKKILKKLLFKAYGLISEKTIDETGIKNNDFKNEFKTKQIIINKLKNSIYNEKIPQPDIQDVKKRANKYSKKIQKKMIYNRTYSRKYFYSGLAAACMLFFIIYFPFKEKITTNAYRLISWKGCPSLYFKKNKHSLKKDILLKTGFSAKTGIGEQILLSFKNTRIHVSGNTFVKFRKIISKNNSYTGKCRIINGLVIYSINNKDFKNYSINIPHGSINVIGSLAAVDVGKNSVKVGLLKGLIKITFNKKKKTHILKSGQAGLILSQNLRIINNPHKNKIFSEMWKVLESKVKKKVLIKKKITNRQYNKIKSKLIITEKIQLKDGTTITGSIINQDNNYIYFRTYRQTVKLPLSHVKQIVYLK